MDLPVWQALYEELRDEGFVVLAVSFDSRAPDQSRQWIESANLTYPALLDPEHEVADLYNMVNVPNAVWVDEDGRIVRPSETAGAGDEWRTITKESMPADLERMKERRDRYVQALRDWVRNGPAAAAALRRDEAAARAKAQAHTAEDALGFAHFRFGIWLAGQGRDAESQEHLEEAISLKPDSWAFKRQRWELQEIGKAGGPEFRDAVNALGTEPYYPQPDILR